jgi:hypothetical protein
MTISTTAAKDLNIDKLVLLACRSAGLVHGTGSVSENQRLAALDLLEVIVNSTATQGRFARAMDFRYILLVSGQSHYDLPTDVIDVVGYGAYIDPSQTATSPSSEIAVSRLTRHDWEMLQGKNSTGTPQQYFVSRETDPAQVWFWPVPSSVEAGGSVRLECHRLRATMSEGQKTPDFERYWQDYFISQLAFKLAVQAGIDTDRCGMLKSEAQEALKLCRGASNQSNHQYMRFGHGTAWSR